MGTHVWNLRAYGPHFQLCSWRRSPRKGYEARKKVGRGTEMGTPMCKGQLEGNGLHKVSQQSDVPRNKWRECSGKKSNTIDGLSKMRLPTDP